MIEENKKNKSGILSKILVLLGIVVVIILGGYLFLDKIIVPKYFGEYGINGMGDLFGVVNSLYKNPKESKLVSNGWTTADFNSAIVKLKESNYNIDENGEIVIEEFKTNAETVELTDREFASICNKFIEKGAFIDVLPKLNYINISNIKILELNVNIDENSIEDETYSKAHISFIAKIVTGDLREQIASQMDTPISLLKMIVPDELYFSVAYNIDLSQEDENRITNGKIAINGRTSKQSEILIKLLVDFIFPPEDEMTLDKFTDTLGNIILKGVDELGEFKFKKVDNRSGFFINPQKEA